MKALLSFAPLLARLGPALTITLILALVATMAGIALLGLSGWFLTAAALSTAGSAFNLFAPSAGVRGLSFIRILARYGEKLSGHNATLKLLSDLRKWLFGKLFRLPTLTGLSRADMVSRLTADIDALDTAFLLAIGPALTALLSGAVVTALLAWLHPMSAPIYALGFAAAVLVVPTLLVMGTRRLQRDIAISASNLRDSVLSAVDGHADLLVLGALDEAAANAKGDAQTLAAQRQRLATAVSFASFAVQGLAGLVIATVLVTSLPSLEAGSIDGPLFAGLLLAIVASFEVTATLVRSSGRLSGAAAAAERVRNLTDAVAPRPQPVEGAAPEPGIAIRFQDLSFGYDNRATILDRVGFAVREGECVALTGPSGSGKSTIAYLAAGLLAPRSGQVIIDGQDVAAIPPDTLHRHVSLMMQDAPVFHDSVRNNLLIGNPDATDDELWAVLRRVSLEPAIRALPGGLGAAISEAGRSLSLGQARRLTLARSLLSPAPVLILDEPTSGLDPDTERALLADLPVMAAGRTLLVISHAAIPASFDRCLALRAGRLVPGLALV